MMQSYSNLLWNVKRRSNGFCDVLLQNFEQMPDANETGPANWLDLFSIRTPAARNNHDPILFCQTTWLTYSLNLWIPWWVSLWNSEETVNCWGSFFAITTLNSATFLWWRECNLIPSGWKTNPLHSGPAWNTYLPLIIATIRNSGWWKVSKNLSARQPLSGMSAAIRSTITKKLKNSFIKPSMSRI